MTTDDVDDGLVLVTVREACRRLGIGRTKFYQLRNAGLIETVDVVGAVRVHVRDIDACAERLPRRGAGAA